MQNECHITASERLYRLISNGSSASGILPADVFVCVWRGGGLRSVKLAVHPQRKASTLWGFQTYPLTPPLPSPLYFPHPLYFFCLLFTACSLSVINSVVSFFPLSPPSPSWKSNSNIYSCRYVTPLLHTPPQPPLLCKIPIGLRESSYSITNGPPTRPLTTLTFFYGRGKMDRLNVSTQVIIRPHLFNEIRLSAPGKELRKQNASPPPLI